jgi:hypothetical protein
MTYDDEENLINEISELNKQMAEDHNNSIIRPIKRLTKFGFLNNKMINSQIHLYDSPNFKMNPESYFTYPNFGNKIITYYDVEFGDYEYDYLRKDFLYTFYGIKLIK